MILHYKNSHSDVLFGFREILQFVTVHPNFSETRYLISDIGALCEVESIHTCITVHSEIEKSTQFCVFLGGSVRNWQPIDA